MKYWNAWLLIMILFIPMLIVGIVLMVKNPELLRKRLNSKENEPEKKRVIIGGLMCICGFVVAGLGYRYRWIVIVELMCFYFVYAL